MLFRNISSTRESAPLGSVTGRPCDTQARLQGGLATMLALGLCTVSSTAFGIVDLGDNSAIMIEGQVAVESDSNVFANSEEKDDILFTLSPTVAYEKKAGVETRLAAGAIIGRFSDYNDEDFENLFATFSMKQDLPNNAWAVNLDARENSSANDIVGGRTESNDFTGKAAMEVMAFGKSGIRFEPSLEVRDYKTVNTYDYTIAAAEVGYVWAFRPKLKLSADYRFRDITSDAPTGFSGTDNSFFVSARGEFSPKLTGTLSLGAQFRDADNPSANFDDTRPYARATLTYTLSPKTSFTGALTSDSASSAVGHDSELQTISLSVRQVINPQLTVTGGINAANNTYTLTNNERDDDVFGANASAQYKISQNLTGVASVSYHDQSSSLEFMEYSRLRLKLAVQGRY